MISCAESYQIRLARYEEVPRLPEIERAASQLFQQTTYSFLAGAEPLSLEFLAGSQQHNLLWVAADSHERPVGFALLQVVDGSAHLHELSVHPAHARRGLGRKLVDTVCAWAQQQGYPAITLCTFRTIPWNAPFYSTLGFQPLAEHELGRGLQTLRRYEALHGLPVTERVCMRRSLAA